MGEKKLKEHPQKDGLVTEYECGLMVSGTWRSRIEKYNDFLGSKMGSYILKLENLTTNK